MGPINKKKPINPMSPKVVGDIDPWYSFLFYGLPRSGKTTLGAGAHLVQGMGPEVVMAFGQGYRTLIDEPDFGGLEVYTPTSIADASAMYNWLRPDTDGDGTGGNAIENYGTLLVDELDSLYGMFMRKRLEEVHAEKPDRSLDKPALDDYGVVHNQMLYFIEQILKLPCHVIMTAWADIVHDEVDNKDFIMPAFPPKLANRISGKVQILSYLEFGLPKMKGPNTGNADNDGVRLAHFAASRKFLSGVWGKSKAERLGAEIANPTMQEIYTRLQGA